MRLKDKRAIVIGAAGEGNMGQVIADRLIAEGATVMVAGRKRDILDRFVARHAGHAHAAVADITSTADNDALADAAVAAMGGIDIAINATGWGLLKPFLEMTAEDMDAMCALQFRGPFLFFQAVLKRMAGPGALIQISSATATIMLHDHAAYMGTKAGFDHVMRCIANEFGARGIRANSVAPGLTDTPMTAAGMATPGLEQAFLAGYPLGRIGTSEDIAEACVFLASDACFMTGQTLQVNGGLTLRRNPTAEEIQASVMAAMAKAG